MLRKPQIPTLWMTFILAAFFVFAANIVLLDNAWDALKRIDDQYSLFALTIPVFLMAVFTTGIALLSHRRVVKPLFIVLILLSAVISYAMHTYGIVFDKNMIANIIETNPAEASSYLNAPVLIWFFFMGVVPAVILSQVDITYPPVRQHILQKLALIGVMLAVVLVIAIFYFKDYASLIRNNPALRKDLVPTYALDAAYSYTKKTYFTKVQPYQIVGADAKQYDPDIGEKKELVVLVVGETQRSMNYELNGYDRPTNAFTKKHDIISFTNTTSCGTATAVSVPCMFSNLTKDNYSKEKSLSRDNLLDVAKRSGVYVLWLDNDSGCKDVCGNVETVDLRAKYRDDKKQCVGDGCHDSVFLTELEQRFDSLPDQTGLVILHIMGSHGPTYFNRYPADHRFFTPDCRRSDIQNCTHEELVNTYDNTIRYSDYVIAHVIDILKKNKTKRNSALIFMSDHGESLGEKGLYLHGMPYAVAPDEQTHIPFMLWMSRPFANDRGVDLACVKRKLASNPYSHDNLFHTVLGMLAIEADAYNKDLDVLTPCKTGIPDMD